MGTDFDREMESYIAKRRQTGLFSSVAKAFKRKKPAKLGPDVEAYDSKPSAQKPAAPSKEAPHMESSDEQPAEESSTTKPFLSGLSAFFKSVFTPKKTAEPATEEGFDEQPEASYKTDMKELCRIMLDMAKKLPDDELKEFKSSDDFSKMKGILRKHQVIK